MSEDLCGCVNECMCVSGSPFSQALRAPKGPDQVCVSDCMKPGTCRLLSEAVSDPGWHSWGLDTSPHKIVLGSGRRRL